MQSRLLLITCFVCAAYGCATENQPAGASQPQPSASRGEATYRTGSRLPTYDSGTAATREISRDDYIDERARSGGQGIRQ